jgi:hypothetical protein
MEVAPEWVATYEHERSSNVFRTSWLWWDLRLFTSGFGARLNTCPGCLASGRSNGDVDVSARGDPELITIN